MKLFKDCLIPLTYDDIDVKLIVCIKQVKANPFFQDLNGDTGVKHYVLELSSKYRFKDDDDSGEYVISTLHPLLFYYSGCREPSIDEFGAHIKNECNAARTPFTSNPFRCFARHSSLTIEEVWKFIKAQNKDYSHTIDFIRDYDYWENRLYHTLKWMAYISGNLYWSRDEYVSIGTRLFEFLDFTD